MPTCSSPSSPIAMNGTPFILTSDKSYAQWAEIFSGEAVIVSAILDCVLHHSRTIAIRGQSYRLRDKLKAGVISRKEEVAEENQRRGVHVQPALICAHDRPRRLGREDLVAMCSRRTRELAASRRWGIS
jgi:hypothetical protein